ncbi:MAG: carbon-nitrogen hydrolase [Halieaceae bacterium]|nr:carbon-nitrogen hydrolase [Halieaceae bacterium]MCP5164211.1 carbon-nitrogen hydrolase [Pseudomonadales bacterium]MCP5203528.1 carbon-nitrogen hydrolase [Pseudomonadales bacterium]
MLKVALVQQRCSADVAANQAESESQIRRAAGEGAQLVVLQELHSGLYFCQTEDTGQFDLAEPLDGPSRHRFEDLARELDIVLVISLFEKRATGLYHNTALVMDADRGCAGYYRKMHIPDDPGYYEKFYFTPGDAGGELAGFTPIATRVGRLGVLVCWDQWYPEAARLMALAGADMLIYPTAIGWNPADEEAEKQRQLGAWQIVQRGHAVANGLPVIVSNRTGMEPSPDGEQIQFWGHSFVAGPQGELLAQAPADEPTLLLADIDLQRSEDVRRIWPFLRDRRIDAYGNIVRRFID